MNWWLLAWSAIFLSLERIAYIVIWHRPEAFRRRSAMFGDPVLVVRGLFVAFKMIQAGVFAAWISWYGVRLPESPVAILFALALIVAGQILNAGVFAALGKTGVFYGNRFGHDLPWCSGFPFSLVAHPQYVGTVLSIWGLFVLTRFPGPDWYILPALETAYYIAGARYEQ